MELGVERLVLPAVPSVLQTWTSSFGFSVMTEAQKMDFLGYTFLDFQGTHMCQKRLAKGQSSAESSISRGVIFLTCHLLLNNSGDWQQIKLYTSMQGTFMRKLTEAMLWI